MLLEAYLQDTHELATPDQWKVVRDSLPQTWVEEALQATGVATLRKRRLPMEQAVWLVLGIALLRDRSILHVADALEIALPGEGI
ncbi:transposase domain-containing protein, partial [Dyella jejuensis]